MFSSSSIDHSHLFFGYHIFLSLHGGYILFIYMIYILIVHRLDQKYTALLFTGLIKCFTGSITCLHFCGSRGRGWHRRLEKPTSEETACGCSISSWQPCPSQPFLSRPFPSRPSLCQPSPCLLSLCLDSGPCDFWRKNGIGFMSKLCHHHRKPIRANVETLSGAQFTFQGQLSARMLSAAWREPYLALL